MCSGKKCVRASSRISRGVPSRGSCPSTLRANARVALRRASSSVSSGSAPSEVADGDRDVFGDGTEDEIFESEGAGRNAEADGAGLLSGRKAGAARPWIDAGREWITPVGSGGRPGEVRPRTGTGVDHSLLLENLQRRVVVREARGLKDDLAVPSQAVTLERAEDLVRGSRHDARRVEILEANQPPASRGAGEQPRAQRGDEAAGVKGPRGGGRKSPGDGA
jgi:hypothetical protein